MSNGRGNTMNKDLEERIKLFKIVRDIPYYISVGEGQDYSCATKPYILDKLFQSIGLKVKHVLGEFRWSKLNLPEELLQIPHEDIETHEYLTVLIPERNTWVKIDPTWDSKIKHSAIGIAEWDGLHDTKLAVPLEREWSPEESEKLIAEEENWTEEQRQEYLRKNGEFFQAFNRWLDAQRRSPL